MYAIRSYYDGALEVGAEPVAGDLDVAGPARRQDPPVLLLILVAAEPPVTLFMIGLVYVLSGPFSAVYRFMHRTEKSVEEQENTI